MERLFLDSRPQYMARYAPWILVLAILACNLSTSAPPTRPVVPPSATLQLLVPVTSTPPPAVTYQPAFESAPCAFPVPAGENPECGYLVVPENRTRPETRWIRLHVALFRNRSGIVSADPVVHLAGGPGSSSLGVAGYMFNQGLGAVSDQRELILFDQRGTGYSQPRLDCPERASVTGQALERGLSSVESQGIILDALRRCRDRLIGEGIDLSAYHSAASAADLNDLRVVLGYEQLNLYAVSYGTRLALTMMRDYPQAVRSAVLDSAYPLQVNLYTALAPNADRAFNVFFDRCAADPTCSSSYPDLRNVFFQLVDQLNASPIYLTLYAAGAEHTIRLDGGLLIDVLFVGLYNPAVTASMPEMINDTQQGNYDILRERLALYFDTSSATGMQMSVQCAEEIPFNTIEEAYAAAQGIAPQVAVFYPASVQPLFQVCKDWTGVPLDPRENQPVVSDVPAFILAGEHDPITPPDWGRMVSQELTRAYFREFAGQGHWVTRSSQCALSMALAFWQDPTQDPGPIC